jgi:hypothetical protein
MRRRYNSWWNIEFHGYVYTARKRSLETQMESIMEMIPLDLTLRSDAITQSESELKRQRLSVSDRLSVPLWLCGSVLYVYWLTLQLLHRILECLMNFIDFIICSPNRIPNKRTRLGCFYGSIKSNWSNLLKAVLAQWDTERKSLQIITLSLCESSESGSQNYIECKNWVRTHSTEIIF